MTERTRRSAFSLVELLLATAILAIVAVVLTSILSAASRAWTTGEQQVAKFQDGRAILELVSRELSHAVISPQLQFVQNPSFPAGMSHRAYSDSIFWQAPIASTSSGNLAEIGYYLTADFQLRRFFVPPTDAANYQIFTPANRPTATSAPWVSSFVSAATTTPVATGVLAMWVRCFDINGDPIPWLSSSAVGVGPLRFNSAAHFQPAVARPSPSPSFKYTNSATTAQAHLLPNAVELTIVTLDPQTLSRPGLSVPDLTAAASPADIPTVRDAFNQALIARNITTARTFTTRVHLPAAPR